jgi:hypothetical protein
VSIFAPVAPPRTLILEEEGTALPLRSRIDVQGAGATVTDDPANNQLILSIPGGGGGGSGLPDGWYSLKGDFGAVGNGVADDTAAVQAALDTVWQNKVLLCEPGIYSISAVNVKGAPKVIGAGGAGLNNETGTIFRRRGTSTTAMFTHLGDLDASGWFPLYGAQRPFVFEDIMFDNYSAGGSVNNTAFKAERSAYFRFTRCFFWVFDKGIHSLGGLIYVLDQCHFGGGNYGMYIESDTRYGGAGFVGANHIMIRDTTFGDITTAGVSIGGGDGNSLIGCDIEGCGIGLEIRAGVQTAGPLRVRDCWWERNTTGTSVQAGAPMTVFDGCNFLDTMTVAASRTQATKIHNSSGALSLSVGSGSTVYADPSSNAVITKTGAGTLSTTYH